MEKENESELGSAGLAQPPSNEGDNVGKEQMSETA